MSKGKLIDPGQFCVELDKWNDKLDRYERDLDKVQKVIEGYQSEDLENWTTPELMSLLRSNVGRDIEIIAERIRSILADRPNLPTKAQAKKARQARAHEVQNR